MRVPQSWLTEVVQKAAPGWSVTAEELDAGFVSVGFEIEDVIPLPPITGPLVVGRVRSIEELTEFKKPVTITLIVDEAQLITKLAGRATNLVKLAFFNGSRWVLVQESSLGSGGTVSGRVTHLTEFRVVIAVPVSNLGQATVYPNPYRPSLPQQLSQGIKFDQVPANTSIKIYTLAGDLVRELADSDADGVVAWDGKNGNGQDVASGVYFALLKGGGDTKTIKVAVQR